MPDNLLPLLATILLNCPPDSSPPDPLQCPHPTIVRRVALAMDLGEGPELDLYFNSLDSWAEDWNTMRRRAIAIRGAPPLSRVDELPPLVLLEEACRFNRRCACHFRIAAQLDWLNFHSLNEAALQCDDCYAVWDSACNARRKELSPFLRRVALKRVLELNKGLLSPLGPVVPVWAFQQ